MAPTIRIDDDVYAWLQEQARAFEDTPNTVLRRVAGLDSETAKAFQKRRYVRDSSEGKAAKTPQGAYRKPVLRALKKLGGKASRSQVFKELEKAMADRFTRADTKRISSGDLRWQKTAEWEVTSMRDEGLLLPVSESGRGNWALSDAGDVAARAS
jgi:predicted CopG family antitoxin